jgi:hypothetical protein
MLLGSNIGRVFWWIVATYLLNAWQYLHRDCLLAQFLVGWSECYFFGFVDIYLSLTNLFSLACLFLCFLFSFVVPTHLVGPGEIIPVEGAQLVDTERAAYSVEATLAAKEGIPVNDTMNEDDDYAFFQVISRHVGRAGKKIITRVSTHKFEVGTDVSEFLDSVDDEAVSVVLAKAAVY